MRSIDNRHYNNRCRYVYIYILIYVAIYTSTCICLSYLYPSFDLRLTLGCVAYRRAQRLLRLGLYTTLPSPILYGAGPKRGGLWGGVYCALVVQ